MNKNSKNKIIYGYVRCETKHCANNFKILKVPKTLVGKQICQICKNVMFKVNVDKNLEVIENKKTKNKKKLDHFCLRWFGGILFVLYCC